MKLLNFKELQAKLGGRGRSSVYRDIEAGRIPKPVRIGSRLYWTDTQIDSVISELAE